MSTKLNIRPYNNKEQLLFPASIGDYLPKDHLAHVIDEVVDRIDLTLYYRKIPEVGNPSYHPALMIKIWFYGYCVKVYSLCKIEEKLHTDVAFIYLSGMQKPDFKTIAEFRRKHIEELKDTFVEILRICHCLGMTKLGNIAIDSKVMKANASASRTYTEEELVKEQQKLRKAIQEYLDESEQIDQQEDQKYGCDKRGDELPQDIRDKETRIKKIKQILEQIKQAEQKLKNSHKKKINLTDNDAQFQKDKSRKIIGYRCQVAVDSKQQIIVANDVTEEQADQSQLLPMVKQVIENIDEIKQQQKQPSTYNSKKNTNNNDKQEDKINIIADSGYSSTANLKELEKYEDRIEAYIPDQHYQAKTKINSLPFENVSPFHKDNFLYDEITNEYICPLGNKLRYIGKKRNRIKQIVRIYRCNNSKNCMYFGQCTTSSIGRTIESYENTHLVEKMRKKLSQQAGKKIFSIRKITAEPVLGNLTHNLGFKEFLLRGLQKVKAEFSLMCIAHNLLKIAKFLKNLHLTLKEALVITEPLLSYDTS